MLLNSNQGIAGLDLSQEGTVVNIYGYLLYAGHFIGYFTLISLKVPADKVAQAQST